MTRPYPRGTLQAVATRYRLSLSHVSRVAAGERPSRRITAALEKEATRRKLALARNVAAT